MASIFERISLIVRSNVNDLLDNFEDPAKVIDQTIIDAKTELGKMKKQSLPVLANETTTKEQVDAYLAEADKWHGIAANALKAGNEEDAREALAKENAARSSAAKAEANYAAAKEAADALRAKLKEIEENIEIMKSRAAEIKATSVTAQATKTAANLTDTTTGAFENFDRMAEKAAQELAEAKAVESLSHNAAKDAAKELEEKYGAASPASVDESLAALKEELGMTEE